MTMDQMVYRYRFNRQVPLQEVEESLLLAVLAVECLHGRTSVRLNASFCLDKGEKACVVDGSCEVGRDIASIFTGFLTREFGEDAFRVERLEGTNKVKPNNWKRIPGLFNRREIEQVKEPGKEYRQEPRGTDNWEQEVFALYYKFQEDKGGE